MGEGRLSICATPIGNLDDATFRLIDMLKGADAILAEDTRVTSKLCARYGIDTRIERCDDNVIREKTPQIIERVSAGERIALVSDAGTPGISDPGSYLIGEALAAGVEVEVIPGPTALISALVGSGLPAESFFFGGFLPRKASRKLAYLRGLASLDATLVFYESPHRTRASLEAFCEVFAGRECAVARELTKLHEEFIRGTVEGVLEVLRSRETIKGEIVLLVGPPLQDSAEDAEATMKMLRNRRDGLLEEGMPRSEIVKVLVSEFDIGRNEAYEVVHELV